jgi:hypothetical protein
MPEFISDEFKQDRVTSAANSHADSNGLLSASSGTAGYGLTD